MKLFLASQDFGNYGDKLSQMVGDNRRSLVVFNALDYKDDKGYGRQKELFEEYGLEFQGLDLRNYFDRQNELRQFIDKYQPGLVVLLGGNTFLLRRALFQSGFDDILRHDVGDNKYVLAGHSAGAIVAGPSLKGFERMDKEKLVLPGYQSDIVWDGLGLTGMRVISHADSPKYEAEVISLRQELFDKNQWDYVVLNDSDVFVVDNEGSKVYYGVN